MCDLDLVLTECGCRDPKALWHVIDALRRSGAQVLGISTTRVATEIVPGESPVRASGDSPAATSVSSADGERVEIRGAQRTAEPEPEILLPVLVPT